MVGVTPEGKIQTTTKYEVLTDVTDDKVKVGYFAPLPYPNCFKEVSKQVLNPSDIDFHTLEGGAGTW